MKRTLFSNSTVSLSIALLPISIVSLVCILTLQSASAQNAAPGSPGTGVSGTVKPASPPAPTASVGVMQIKKSVTGDLSYRFVSSSDKPGGVASATAPVPLPAAPGSDNIVAIPIPTSVNVKETQIEILDNGKGNLARLPIDTKTVANLSDNSFNTAIRISVPIQAKGLGVIGAQATMTNASKKFTQTRLLQPDDNGVARFDNVPLNEPVTVSVSYGTHPPESITKTLTPTRPAEAWSPIAVDWTDAKTVAPPTPVASTSGSSGAISGSGGAAGRASNIESAPARPLEPPNPLNSLVSLVVSLLFLGGIGYGGFWAYKTGRLKTFLDKLGINTAETATAGAQGANPFTANSAPPLTPITEGTADPFGGAPGLGGGFAASPVSTGPRLIATSGTYSGTIFPISGGFIDIGRDPGNGVPMPDDTNTSRKHATISGGNGQFTLTDNGSSNGTFLNGVRAPGMTPQPLRQGDEIQVGMTRFRFEA